MERIYESETKITEIDIEIEEDEEEEIEIAIPLSSEECLDSAPRNTRLYAQAVSGFVVIVALLFVPLITLPGMVILVLIAEVYLLDWTYFKVSLIRGARSSISNEYTGKSPENEIDRKIARTSPKDQFVR